jgi:hypothetical protein
MDLYQGSHSAAHVDYPQHILANAKLRGPPHLSLAASILLPWKWSGMISVDLPGTTVLIAFSTSHKFSPRLWHQAHDLAGRSEWVRGPPPRCALLWLYSLLLIAPGPASDDTSESRPPIRPIRAGDIGKVVPYGNKGSTEAEVHNYERLYKI